ncbi:aminoglycoside adenylyltransferase domain-containing protein [Sutcliffiella rhizosphaerae]|uniref:Spectinomycin 9-adenylyltransferase n=1 Tax=Sutcliffiella rhizosphaerae TaxID=2880967 RepID=A0ABM8YNK7_9BACI|nr:aminoglycoside adenylyltransferase domain-containing protein [Sutcliffiella rhizosphaerae]CAG9621570.1 hypothetical protein BACCIP111883_02343 [Sutcliffiella rhizosphaerae]
MKPCILLDQAVEAFLKDITSNIKNTLQSNYTGTYLHGSVTLGGFNPNRSDIDILVVTKSEIPIASQLRLARFFLQCSKNPYPIEISFLAESQLSPWFHPTPYEFHYSEAWREIYLKEMETGRYKHINEKIKNDPDLAAHITNLNYSGTNFDGPPIHEIFPQVPKKDYLATLLLDFKDCLTNMEQDPVYTVLNTIRVYKYVKDGEIISKKDAGQYGEKHLPYLYNPTIKKVVNAYSKNTNETFSTQELSVFKAFIHSKIEEVLP